MKNLVSLQRTFFGALAAISLLGGTRAHADLDVVVDINQIKCIDENDSFTNDEPYVIVIPFFVDGSTVQVDQFVGGGFGAKPSSSVTVLKSSKTHGNIKNGDDWCDEGNNGKWYNIPASAGEFKQTMKPISPSVIGPMAKKVAIAGVIVAVVEEDGSTVQAANATRDAIVSTLKDELLKAVFHQSFDVNKIRQKVITQAKNAAISATVQNLTVAGVVDPDDLMGADADTWTYEQLEEAGTGGIPISMRFKHKDDGDYEIKGKVRVIKNQLPSSVSTQIKRISAVGNFSESPDFYAAISIAGNKKQFPHVDDKAMIEPNWSHSVNVGQDESISISISVHDYDSTSGDDSVDINPNKPSGALPSFRHLTLLFDRVKGEIFQIDPTSATPKKKIGMKGQTITLKGSASDESAEIRFVIQ
jgi:hypothetical protein